MTPLAKRLGILLAVSIGLNLLLAGLWLGRGLHGGRGHGAPTPSASRDDGEARRRPALRRAFEGKAPEFAARRRAAQATRARVAQSLEQEPFDRGSVERALAELRAESSRSQELMHDELARLAERSSAAERREMARTFMRQRP